MVVFKKTADLQAFLQKPARDGATTGFVPTMGALHAGHLSLLAASKSNCSLTVASIFVNPAQFNNPDDFTHYPVTTEKDVELLVAAGCDVLFLPGTGEIYPPGYKAPIYSLGYLETVLEGKYRPGHFQGVCQVMDRLLDIVRPTDLFMGRKDLQQCLVVKQLLTARSSACRFIECPILREPDGLAMSSRNSRLTAEQRKQAVGISAVLQHLKTALVPGSTAELLEKARSRLEAQGFDVDYLIIARTADLAPVDDWDGDTPVTALAAASLGNVRLIDNLPLR